jgi:hypothetical protein
MAPGFYAYHAVLLVLTRGFSCFGLCLSIWLDHIEFVFTYIPSDPNQLPDCLPNSKSLATVQLIFLRNSFDFDSTPSSQSIAHIQHADIQTESSEEAVPLARGTVEYLAHYGPSRLRHLSWYLCVVYGGAIAITFGYTMVRPFSNHPSNANILILLIRTPGFSHS